MLPIDLDDSMSIWMKNSVFFTILVIIDVFELLQTPNDDKLATNALWGKLAAEILMQNWDAALEDLNKLKDVIDSPVCVIILIIDMFLEHH